MGNSAFSEKLLGRLAGFRVAVYSPSGIGVHGIILVFPYLKRESKARQRASPKLRFFSLAVITMIFKRQTLHTFVYLSIDIIPIVSFNSSYNLSNPDFVSDSMYYISHINLQNSLKTQLLFYLNFMNEVMEAQRG